MIRRSFAALAGFVLVTGVTAGAADAPKPLRTLVYAVQFTAQTKNAEQTSGFDAGGSGGGIGHGMVERGSTETDDGTLTVDVIAPTADAGLVVDAGWVGKKTSHAPVRVGIHADGSLSYDPGKGLGPQARRFLPLLARGVVAARNVAPGSTWTTPLPAPVKGMTTYRVAALDGEVASLAIDTDMSVTGPHGFDEQDHATARYATDKLCPVTYDVQARSRRQASPDQYVTEIAHLTATLVSDTFRKT